jgi:hypothetical protein
MAESHPELADCVGNKYHWNAEIVGDLLGIDLSNATWLTDVNVSFLFSEEGDHPVVRAFVQSGYQIAPREE